jgi:hypothetical protein
MGCFFLLAHWRRWACVQLLGVRSAYNYSSLAAGYVYRYLRLLVVSTQNIETLLKPQWSLRGSGNLG